MGILIRVELLVSLMKSFQFRLYPSKKQEARMCQALEASRRLWNDALAHRKMRWETQGLSTSYNMQAAILTSERNSETGLRELHSQVCQDVLRRLDKAFSAFFAHRANYPRFKRQGCAGSFTYPQAYNGSVRPDILRKRIFLSKIGNVRAVFHRPLPKDTLFKTCTIVREADGKWFACLVFEEVLPIQSAVARVMPVKAIGIDLGLLSLITTSDGEEIEHPRFLRKRERRLKHLKRVFSRKKKGSKNRFKARTRVASQYARVGRQRLDFNNKLSARLVKSHDFIAFDEPENQQYGQESQARQVDWRCLLGTTRKARREQRFAGRHENSESSLCVLHAGVLPLRDA